MARTDWFFDFPCAPGHHSVQVCLMHLIWTLTLCACACCLRVHLFVCGLKCPFVACAKDSSDEEEELTGLIREILPESLKQVNMAKRVQVGLCQNRATPNMALFSRCPFKPRRKGYPPKNTSECCQWNPLYLNFVCFARGNRPF